MKEKFLKELEKKLSVLSNEEIKDIIDEYSGIIDDKIKHGKTEEEAVKEFGDIKELSKEILRAYKIDPNYNKSDFSEKTNDFIKTSEEFIKKGAKKLTDVTEEVIENIKNDKNKNDLENIFEILIKVVIVLLLLAILRIPFLIVGAIGSGIFGLDVFPFGGVSNFVWKALVGILYLLFCVFIILTIVNKRTNYIKKQDNDLKKENYKTENNYKDKITKEENSQNYSRRNNNTTDILILIAKIWCIIIILLPLWFTSLGLTIGVCFAVYLIGKGISIYGILLLLLGILGMITYFSDSVWRGLFSKKRIYFYPMFINIILILFGSLMTFEYFANIKYVDNIPNSIELNTKIYSTTIDSTFEISKDSKQIIDNNLEDNVIKIEVDYYSDIYEDIYINISKVRKNDKIVNSLIIDKNYKNSYTFNNDLYKEAIKQLKNDTMFNYSLLNKLNIKIYANEKTLELIK